MRAQFEERQKLERELVGKNQPVSETYDAQRERMLNNAIELILKLRKRTRK